MLLPAPFHAPFFLPLKTAFSVSVFSKSENLPVPALPSNLPLRAARELRGRLRAQRFSFSLFSFIGSGFGAGAGAGVAGAGAITCGL